MQTVLILGATSDIGLAIAHRFAREGYAIQLAARNSDQLEPARSDIAIRFQVPVTTHRFDAMQPNEHAAFYAGLPVKPDVTVCVFGYMTDNEKAITDWSLAERTLHTNYTGAVSILNIIAQDYAQKKKGVIAGISSVAGERGRQSNFIYGSAKAGFTAYLSGLRNYLYHHQVHVLTILPGFVNTKMTAELALPGLLTAQPHQVADKVFLAIRKKKNVLYVKWFWKWIMLIIKLVPESMFKKKKL